jgi:multiple sugar transport system substrate-binding protein
MLRGVTWDHVPLRAPLEATAADWSNATGVQVCWDARPRREIDKLPLERLAAEFDVLLIDHSFVGAAASSGLIVPVEEWADADYLADQANQSVGPTFASYAWRDRQWALAIDASCQVSAVREDLWFGAALADLPSTWEDVEELATDRRRAPSRVAIPLNADDAYCVFLAMGTALAGTAFWPSGSVVDTAAGAEVLTMLRKLAACLHPASRVCDSVGISDRTTESDEILYVPLMFGRSVYARSRYRPKPLRFGNAPRGGGGTGSLLGGVGVALSARSANRDAAAELARRLAAPEVQAGIYARSGGQPVRREAWESRELNAETGGFFRSIRASMDNAALHPRVPGQRCFRPRAGDLIHRFIWADDMTARECLAAFGYLVETLLPEWIGCGFGAAGTRRAGTPRPEA